MRNLRVFFIMIAAVSASTVLLSCGDPSKKLQEASKAENGGDAIKAIKTYAAVSRRATSALKFPESRKGKVIAPAVWKEEAEKYLKGVSEPAAKANAALSAALDGLDRCMGRIEPDNSANFPPRKPLDDKAFAPLWNIVFPPPPAGGADWDDLKTFAERKRFSILQISSPKSYVYDVSVISRGASRRIDFTLYSESKLTIPLPPGDYSVIVKSSVTFQQGQYWESGFSAFNINVSDEPSLITMDLRTKAARRQ
ncbi:MAG: hypothetical protein LBI42_12715 [Chitinispirillales bacterium]|jgi:hypothetical protein|nr:hypothetical protein [Chitinispirillales bacterium]